MVLALAWGLAGRGPIVLADEGAALAELAIVQATGAQAAANPEPELDPELEALPLELSERSTDGRWAPFAKHPVYVTALDMASGAAGRHGPVLLSALGTLLAAAGAGKLGGAIRRDLAVPALWATGLATPLLFDGFLVIGHALGAACVAWAAVAALRALGVTGTRSLLASLAAVGLSVAAVLVRTEAALLVAALAAGVLVARMQPGVDGPSSWLSPW